MKTTTEFVKATLYWPKIVGDKALVNNYANTGREWPFAAEPEDTEFLKKHRLLDRLKDPLAYANRLEDRGLDDKAEAARQAAEGRSDYLLLKKPEFNKDGEKNPPFRIIDSDNEPWGEERLIGNGSKADLKLTIVDWGPGKKKSIWCAAIRVTDLVSYQSDEFAGMDSSPAKEEKPKRKPRTKKTDDEMADLDDDIPF